MYSSIRVLYSPESVDGGYGESHDGGHTAHNEDGDAHHPHDLILASLYSTRYALVEKNSSKIEIFIEYLSIYQISLQGQRYMILTPPHIKISIFDEFFLTVWCHKIR